ncbi:MAG: hypothetical protein HZB91_11690 [Elusimicrobia bacterium]|nr:hypothetical protein [Elusimicrobiota bacterium]
MSLRWTSATALLALPLLLLAAGCKEDGEDASAVPTGFDASAPSNIPERARFGRKSSVWTPKTEALLDRARTMASNAGPSGPAVDDASLYRDGAAFFDGARFDAQPSGKAMVVKAGMAIDTDGPVKRYDRRVHRDPYRQKQTSLRYQDGSSLDPTTVPYVVVPISQKALLGDLAVVEYRGRKTVAVVGDCGPRFGEASVALAERLGIPADGVSGGVDNGVTYAFYPGPGRKFASEEELLAYLSSGGQSSL